MDQQCSALVKHIKCFSCLPLSLTCLQLKSLINNQPSFRRRLISSRSHTEF